MQISKLQITDPKYWSGMTREEHLGYLGMKQPSFISTIIDRLYDINYGADNVVTFMEQFPAKYIDDEGEYQWYIQGSDERSIPLAFASTDGSTAIASTAQCGLGRTAFYLFFPERYFEVTSVLSGNRPEYYLLRIVEDPIPIGVNWRYKVELLTGDDTLFVPYSELSRGSQWYDMYGQVEDTLSRRGNTVHHTAPFKMLNVTSKIRKNYDVPGNMINAGKNSPMHFEFVDQDGKKQMRWLNKLEWDFFTQFRRDKAKLLMYGKSNRLPDGTYGNKGESGNIIKSGFGLYEQMEGGNLSYYNNLTLNMLTDFALSISVGKFKEDTRKFVLSTGEYGAYEFHKAASQTASGLTWLRSDHNFNPIKDGKISLDEGQIMKYVSVNGIEFNIIIDPMKDNEVINHVRYKQGLASSYIYDIWDFGTTAGEPNIQRVLVKDNEEHFRYIPGMRDPFTPGGKGTNNTPVMTASPVDGYSVYKMFTGGILVRNPKKTGRIIPSVLQ
jgi:hypothetical protein